MITIESIARSALDKDNLKTRSLVQEFFRSDPTIAEIPYPQLEDRTTLSMAAALLELFALRRNTKAPTWTTGIDGSAEPIFLVKSASRMKRLRELCLRESPEPLRKRHFYAPPDYLDFA